MAKLIGQQPNQVPINSMLGNLAFQNKESTTLDKLTVTKDSTYSDTANFKSAITRIALPSNSDISATITIANMKNLLLTGTPVAAINYTLPLGTAIESSFSVTISTDQAIEWSVINLGTAANTITILGNTGHTLVGNMVVTGLTSARFCTRKTATNVYVTYRIA